MEDHQHSTATDRQTRWVADAAALALAATTHDTTGVTRSVTSAGSTTAGLPNFENLKEHANFDATAAQFKRFYERFRDDLPAYEFYDSFTPFHSSYDNWHFFGRERRKEEVERRSRGGSRKSVETSRPSTSRTRSENADTSSMDGSEKPAKKERWVVARVSKHSLRLEREFKLAEILCKSDNKHFVRPLEFGYLPGRRRDETTLCYSIVEAPGRNYLRDIVEFGPNFYQGSPESPQYQRQGQVPLLTFLDFAIGATEACEILHHGNDMIHGELRADAFHYNRETGVTRMINFGSGARSFENGLTSAGWSSLMSERGVEHKLQFIAPEQTGRLPAEPDTRTDIYSLGILFYTMLTGQPAFEGETPLDIMQNVLSRRIPLISNIRREVPDALAAVIQKMTNKVMDDRYNSTSGVKHDLQALKTILTDGDEEALAKFRVAKTDVSCFFKLPPTLVGREEQKKIVLDVIEDAASRSSKNPPVTKKGLYSLSSSSSAMSGGEGARGNGIESSTGEDNLMSDTTSSNGGGNGSYGMDDRASLNDHAPSMNDRGSTNNQQPSRLASVREEPQPERATAVRTQSTLFDTSLSANSSHESLQEGPNGITPSTPSAGTDGLGSSDNRGSMNPNNAHGSEGLHRMNSNHNLTGAQASLNSNTLHGSGGMEPSSLLRTAQKLKRAHRTDVIAICGSAGCGKSSLVQAIAPIARKHGYFTAAKFDSVRNSPFEPILRVMSSLFRQVFSENDVNTTFHENLRTFVRPFWGVLHSSLELPHWLLQQQQPLGHLDDHSVRSGTPTGSRTPAGGSIKPERKMCRQQSTSDWLRAGGSNKTTRFMHVFLDVLRLLAVQKFICFCLDDLQNADPESLNLLQMIVTARIPVVLIVTYRNAAELSSPMRKIISRATKVQLDSFGEDETAQYVSETLHRPREYCLPLVAVVQEKTQGNPFFVREMMDVAYRNKCIYYCWKCSEWEFSLDKLFTHFSSPDEGKFSNNEFIARRLREMPPETQALLAWASLIGNSFSFFIIKRVMACECSKASPAHLIPPHSRDVVAGLQHAINAYVIMPTEEEDVFKFAHDRYVAAADTLCAGYDRREMHYVLSCALMRHAAYDVGVHADKILFEQACHICTGIEAVKLRAPKKAPFRELLYQAAETAREAGARTAGLWYFKNSLELLSDDPWDESQEDASYAETLTLMTRAAEANWYQGQVETAEVLLQEIRTHARDAADKAPAAIIQSRIYAQKGDVRTAFLALRKAIAELGVELGRPSYDKCDEEFRRIMPLLQARELDLSDVGLKPTDRNMHTMGALFVELLSASFWTDALLFYQATLQIINLYLERGIFPQIGLGLIHLASIGVHRFGLVQVGLELGEKALRIFDAYPGESYTIGRGLTLHALFLGHLQQEMRENFYALNKGMEAASAAGDKILHLLNNGIVAAYRIWSSEYLAEVEAYVVSVGEEFPDWPQDLRGGSILVSVRQYARALQGKTHARHSADVLTDEHHSTDDYFRTVRERSSNPDRPLTIYNSYRLVTLYRFGYYKEALALGEAMLPTVDEIWCMRYTYANAFYLALSLISTLREDPSTTQRTQIMKKVQEYRRKIEVAASGNPVNYATWLRLLDAETADVDGRYGTVLQSYEGAIDHATLHGNALDEALSCELYADWMVRRGAARPARGVVLEALAAYRRVGAFGKADHVVERYEFLLYGTRSMGTQDMGTQTDMVDTGNSAYKLDKMAGHEKVQTTADRTNDWLEPHAGATSGTQVPKDQPTIPPSGNLSAAGLDMIDLASILESSQLMSSELNVDKLLEKLTRIIVDSTGAELCGLAVEDDSGGWCVAAVGTPNGVDEDANGTSVNDVQDVVAKQVTLYVLRFKEQVFMRNVLEDERFANVPASWLEENPDGKSMIGLPIIHGDGVLLGSLYCQAPPNTFTERTVTLLKLLVNQISISIANALLFKQVEKVSARNSSMLEVQKQALAQARESEKKAKAAEKKAMEMVRLKDEAAKVKSMFLANVSHELRTPLNGVIGMSEMLKSTPLNKEQEEHADSIRVCADTLLSVINDILDFSKLEAGKMQVFSIPLSLTETISEVVRALSYTNLERGLKTIEKLDLDPKMVVMGDPVRLHQILMNLMSNAYKFTAKGSVVVGAKVESEDAEIVRVTVYVADTGIGISDEQQKKLFLPFSQADSSTARSYGGTGLGLSICKAIIENVMKGRVWLESKPDVGTTVSFTIPFKKVLNGANNEGANGTSRNRAQGRDADPMSIFTPPAIDEGPGARQILSLAGIPRDQLKVCIAEDNPINQKIAINFVRKLGFKPEAFADGQQAVDALGKASADGQPFHLVLMDVQMPVLDGYNATREIRKHADPLVRDILVIAMTASAIRGDREKCLEAGMNNYLAKPVRADTLKQMLESYLNQPAKDMPNLQNDANKLVDKVVAEVETGVPAVETPERPRSVRHETTKIHLDPEEMASKQARTASQRRAQGSPSRPERPHIVRHETMEVHLKSENLHSSNGKEAKGPSLAHHAKSQGSPSRPHRRQPNGSEEKGNANGRGS